MGATATKLTRVPRRKQTAVYWAPDTTYTPNGRDDYGQRVYLPGVEIACRWEDVVEEFLDDNGDRQVSRSMVYPDRICAKGGKLWLGDSDDLEDGGASPCDSALEIQQFHIIPDARNRRVLYIAYL